MSERMAENRRDCPCNAAGVGGLLGVSGGPPVKEKRKYPAAGWNGPRPYRLSGDEVHRTWIHHQRRI
nr:MAG TPA_asm: hypothetical protein [Caudoviricetes sp.]